MQLTVDPRAALRARLLGLSPSKRRQVLDDMGSAARAALWFDWHFWRRPTQAPPSWAWRYWVVCSGRGFGKTRIGAEYVREMVATGRAKSIGLVGRTLSDVVKVMVTGRSGILAVTPPDERPVYLESKKMLVWPSGAVAYLYTSEEPDQLRGPELDLVWGDELAAWMRLQKAWENLEFALRATGPKGDRAHAVLTTTPRPVSLIRQLHKQSRDRKNGVAWTTGSTLENRANLDPVALKKLLDTYAGTRIGRQELEAEILDDIEGALWSSTLLDARRSPDYPALVRVIVAVDPSVTSKGAETGIVVVGGGEDGNVYVLEDCSVRGSPLLWGKRVVDAYDRWQADLVVAEVNNGGELVVGNIRAIDERVPVETVTASRGKQRRAEPVSALYEKEPARVFHVGYFERLEKQMTEWSGVEGEESPDRMDALVWGITKLCLEDVETINAGFA